MNDKREMLRHFLAALAYRTQKSLRDMPPAFPAFRACERHTSPVQLDLLK